MQQRVDDTTTKRDDKGLTCEQKRSSLVTGKPVELIQVPDRRLFGPKAAAAYLGIHPQTLKQMTDERQIQAVRFRNRKAYKLEELERVIDELEPYNPCYGEDSEERRKINFQVPSWCFKHR